MTTFYSPFGNQIGASQSGYQQIGVIPNGGPYTLLWPVNGDIDASSIDSVYVISDLTEVISASGMPTGTFRFNLPPTTSVSVGQAFILQNSTGTASISVYASSTDTTPVATASAGQGLRLTVSNNVTVASSSWSSLIIGVGQISVNTGVLAGPSLGTSNGQLIVNPVSFRVTTSTSLTSIHRGGFITQGIGVTGTINLTLPDAIDGYYFHVVNSNTGIINLLPPAAVTIDNQSTKTLNPGESCTVFAQVTATNIPTYYTVGYNKNAAFQFQQRTVMLTSTNNWSASILGTDPETILDFIIVGTPGAVQPTVSLPNVKQLWLVRGIGGSGSTINFSTPGGNTLSITTSGTTQSNTSKFVPIVTNGLQALYAMGLDAPVGGSTFEAAPGTATDPSYTFQGDDTGLYQISNGVMGFSANGMYVGKVDSNGLFVMNIDGGLVA